MGTQVHGSRGVQTRLLPLGRGASLGYYWTSVGTTTSPHMPVVPQNIPLAPAQQVMGGECREHSSGDLSDILGKSQVLTEKMPTAVSGRMSPGNLPGALRMWKLFLPPWED